MRLLKIPACAIACLALLCSATFAQRPFEITWANERLSVRASNAPLADVIAEVGRLTGIEVNGREKLTGLISVDIVDVPAKQALVTILADVNYIMQERPGPEGRPGRQLVVRVHSMAGYALPASALTEPVYVPALAELVAEQAAVVEEEKEEEREDDPDSFDDDVREAKLEASQLANEGAFGPKASVSSLIKLTENLDNVEIRLEALKTLGARPMQAALPSLLKALGDHVLDVSSAVVEILGQATDRASLQAVGQLLQTTANRDVRIGALRVLALRGDPESTVYLRAFVKTVDLKRDPPIRDAVEQMLTEFDRREREKQANDR
jgi:hypothetical protein